MRNIFDKKVIDEIFDVGILLKFLHGFFELLTGIFLVTPGRIVADNLVIAITRAEIAEDPSDLIANYLIHVTGNVAGGVNFFVVFYLLLHGIVNTALAFALLKNKMWAYPWAIAIFGLFIVYQIYRYLHTYSLLLLFLTIFDIFIVAVIWLEYNNKKKKSKKL